MNYCVTVVLFLVLVQSGAARVSAAGVPFRSFDHLSTEAGLAGGADSYLIEPLEAEELKATVEALKVFPELGQKHDVQVD